jgi:hypothetical protein
MLEISTRKIVGVLVALGLGVAPVVTAAPAAAGDPGAAIAAGIGGFALGALAGSAAHPAPPPYYGAPTYYPAPVYDAPPPYRCWRERRPVFDEYGVVIGYRPTRVCE